MRSFQQHLAEFERRGVRVAAVSVDPPEVNGPHRQRLGLAFPLLSDPKAEVIRKYDLLHAGAGENGTDIARPAEFLIDADGTVRWVSLTESFMIRARPDDVLKALDAR